MKKIEQGDKIRVYFAGRRRVTSVLIIRGKTFYAKVAGAIRCFSVTAPRLEHVQEEPLVEVKV